MLTLEAQERIENFEASHSDASCGYGHPNARPPCWFCTHEDAPHNVYEDDASYETIEVMETCLQPSMEDALRHEHSKTKGQDSLWRQDGLETLAEKITEHGKIFIDSYLNTREHKLGGKETIGIDREEFYKIRDEVRRKAYYKNFY